MMIKFRIQIRIKAIISNKSKTSQIPLSKTSKSKSIKTSHKYSKTVPRSKQLMLKIRTTHRIVTRKIIKI